MLGKSARYEDRILIHRVGNVILQLPVLEESLEVRFKFSLIEKKTLHLGLGHESVIVDDDRPQPRDV